MLTLKNHQKNSWSTTISTIQGTQEKNKLNAKLTKEKKYIPQNNWKQSLEEVFIPVFIAALLTIAKYGSNLSDHQQMKG